MATGTFDEARGRGAATNYERFFVPAIGRPAAEQLLTMAEIRPDERVLDVGCGTGIVARLAVERAGPEGRVTGVDVHPGMLAVARATGPAADGVEWREAPAEAMPLDDDSFDVALCQMALQFFADRSAGFREMRRVLAPEGRALVSVPGPIVPLFEVLADALARHLGERPAGFVRQVFSLHDRDELERLARDAGFGDVDVRETALSLALPAASDFLERCLASTPLAAVWGEADEPARSAVRREVLAAWKPFESESGLRVEQRMVVAIAHGAVGSGPN